MVSRFRSLALVTLIGALLGAAPAAARVDDEPLPRFEDRLCPGIVGLKRDAAETVVGLMRGNFEALGLSMAPEATCSPNVVVAFVEDGAAFLRNLSDRQDVLFSDMTPPERAALLAESGPARAVLKVWTRTRDGMRISRRDNLTDLPQSVQAMAHSRIYTADRNDIVSALVLIDRDALAGLSLQQLADYATFRALTRTLPPADAVDESIVGLFAGGGASRPTGLTEFDRKFLTTLYAGVPNLPGSSRLAALTDATGHDFAAEE
jgi:hypothetical protein